LGNLECLKRLIGIIGKHQEECGSEVLKFVAGQRLLTNTDREAVTGAAAKAGGEVQKVAAGDNSGVVSGFTSSGYKSGGVSGVTSASDVAVTSVSGGTCSTDNNDNNHIILVCSAMGKTTNLLIETLDACMSNLDQIIVYENDELVVCSAKALEMMHIKHSLRWISIALPTHVKT
jgi:hypothetical protein